jgi:hypothetical protein
VTYDDHDDDDSDDDDDDDDHDDDGDDNGNDDGNDDDDDDDDDHDDDSDVGDTADGWIRMQYTVIDEDATSSSLTGINIELDHQPRRDLS